MNLALVAAWTLTWLAILGGCWLGWQLLRQNGRLLLRIEELEKRLDDIEFGGGQEPEGLPIGTEAPAFELPDLAGERKSLAQFRGQPLLLIFFNPACGFCRELLPKLKENLESRNQQAEMERPVGGDGKSGEPPTIVIVSTGDAEANRQLFNEQRVSCPVLLQKETEVATAYQASGTPSGYLVSFEGKIASELAVGADALLAQVEGKAENRKQKLNRAAPARKAPPGMYGPRDSVTAPWPAAKSNATG